MPTITPVPNLVAYLTHAKQLPEAVGDRPRQAGMNPVIQRRIGRLEAQEVPIGPGLTPGAQIGLGAFTERQGDGRAGLGLDRAHDAGDKRPGQPGILAALEHDGAEAEVSALRGTLEDFVVRHAIAPEGPAHAAMPQYAQSRAQ